MASQMDAQDDAAGDRGDAAHTTDDPIDDHLLSALESSDDEAARYHLREALQLQIAEMQGV